MISGSISRPPTETSPPAARDTSLRLRQKGIESVKANAPGATVVDNTALTPAWVLLTFCRLLRNRGGSVTVRWASGSSVRVSDAAAEQRNRCKPSISAGARRPTSSTCEELAQAHMMLADRLEYGDLYAIKRMQCEIRAKQASYPDLDRLISALDQRFGARRQEVPARR
jgi:hypothetical protein